MKWPFVSRALYEAALERIDVEKEINQFLRNDVLNVTEQWSAIVKKSDARYDDLVARYHMLRMQGAVTIVPAEAPKPLDPITQAIASASRGDPELRAMMEAQVLVDRAEKKSDADILAAIYVGQSAADGTFI